MNFIGICCDQRKPYLKKDCKDFNLTFNCKDLPDYVTDSYIDYSIYQHLDPFKRDEEELYRLEIKFYEKVDIFLKEYMNKPFVKCEWCTVKFEI